MKDKLNKIVDKLLETSEKKHSLFILQRLFNSSIPFNLPHKIKFLEMSKEKTRLLLPYIRHNKNHLGGIHACATATLGELTTGMTIIKQFGGTSYRYIMEEIQINYLKQAKEEVTSEAIIDEEELTRVYQELSDEKKSSVVIVANILNKNLEVIAVVQSKWQIKDWAAVKFKN